jgi:hypothetical protein
MLLILWRVDQHNQMVSIPNECPLSVYACLSISFIACLVSVEKMFYITAGGASGHHDFCHIQNIIKDMKFDCQLSDHTEELGILSVQGRHR